jgi:hypothetical protein
MCDRTICFSICLVQQWTSYYKLGEKNFSWMASHASNDSFTSLTPVNCNLLQHLTEPRRHSGGRISRPYSGVFQNCKVQILEGFNTSCVCACVCFFLFIYYTAFSITMQQYYMQWWFLTLFPFPLHNINYNYLFCLQVGLK